MALHVCMAKDCDRRLSVNRLMCAGHWDRVPKALKNEYAEAVHRVNKTAHLSAVEAASIEASENQRKVQDKCIKAVGRVAVAA